MAAVFRRHSRKLVVGGGLLAAYVSVDKIPFNPFHTPGTANIEKRYTAGGASPTHQTGVATKLGDPHRAISNEENDTGVGTPSFQKNIGDQRKVVSPDGGTSTSAVKRKLDEANYGHTKGK